MDFTQTLAISYYKTIATINESHNIFLVQHQETQKIFIKKILDIYNIDVYKHLKDHPITGTPAIVDYYEEDNQLMVIEEYISGTSLQEKIQDSDLSPEDILHYMMDLCDILEQLHNIQPAIIHRDIKPSNIVITHFNHVVLLDFNAAKYHSSSSEDTVLLGTHGYAAPEQYGFGSSSPQTDIYALGILLKEMLASIDYKSDFFDFIISKCTQINPQERFQNVGNLKKEFAIPDKPKQKKLPIQNLLDFVPPGYRTKTPWKMVLASLFYSFITWVCLSLEIENTFGFFLWFQRILAFAMVLSMILEWFNYMNIQTVMPFHKNKYGFIRFFGIIIFNFLTLFLICALLAIFNLLYSPA